MSKCEVHECEECSVDCEELVQRTIYNTDKFEPNEDTRWLCLKCYPKMHKEE